MYLNRIVITTAIAIFSVCSAGAKSRNIVDNDDSLVFYLQKNNFQLSDAQKSGAIILSETGSSYLMASTLTYKVERTIKVLSPNVKKEISLVEIPQLGAMNARNIKGEVYQMEDGKIVKQKFSLDNAGSLSKSVGQLEFALPELPVGSIVHYSFTLEFFPVVTLANWQFQHKFPTIKSTFQNTVPSMLNCFINLQSSVPYKKVADEDELANLDAGVFTEDYGEGRERTTIWVRRNIPAFNPLSLEDSTHEALSLRINMNSWSNWSVLNGLYFKYHVLYALAFEDNGFLKKAVNRLVIGKQSSLDKAEAIYSFVRDSIAVNNDLFSSHIDLQKVLKERQGNSRDVNVLLAAMLQNAGLTASPMLLRSKGQPSFKTSLPGLNNYVELGLSLNARERQDFILEVAKGNMVPVSKLLEISYGRTSKAIYTNLKQMNQTGVYLQTEGKSYFLVINQDKLPFGTLPKEDINQSAWVISKDGGFWAH